MGSSNFELIYTVHGDGNIPVTKYRSKKTGLSVFIAQVEGPLVNGYFCLATEAHDDDGLPHTLEHLIFLGSEDYPYKGVLDLLANRCLASGTNAWTDTDHTCYTMTTAGSEGFLNLLPIYLDHILYPTLTESGYVTEVHHINEEGEDAGVVYCEMQGRENSGESRCHLAMIRALYPGHCGYKSETGGVMKNLRESTSHKKVCNYHGGFYRPENLHLVITGQVESEAVFNAIQSIEEKITSKGSRGNFDRPWQSPVPPFTDVLEEIVPYPADEEKSGMVYVAWRGPVAKDQYSVTAVSVMLDYFRESPISPLQKAFVEIEDPYCSQVEGSIIENAVICTYFMFKNVVKEKLRHIHPKLIEEIRTTWEGSLDMERMNSIIHRKILECLNGVEDQPHDTIAFNVIGDVLYGDNKDDLEGRVNNITRYRKMKTEPEAYWKNIIQTNFIDKPHVVIIGEPSQSLMESMGKEEKDRVARQREELGEEGLEEKGDTLENAMEENEKEAPESLLTCVDVPDVSKIHFHPIFPTSNLDKASANKNNKFPLSNIPFRFQLDDLSTNFVQMNALLDSSAVSPELKFYLPLFCEVLFESPMMKNRELISHEEVIKMLQADTLFTSAGLGLNGGLFGCGSYAQIVHIAIKVEQEKYERGVEILKDILFNTKFTPERLKIVGQKMNNEVASSKRKGMKIVRTVMAEMLYDKDNNNKVNSMLRQEKFLTDLLNRIETNPEQVVEAMESLRQTLISPSNMRIHMTANVGSLANEMTAPQSPWLQFLDSASGNAPSDVVKQPFECILPLDKVTIRHAIVGIGSVETKFFLRASPCISSFYHEDLPAVHLFLQYVSQFEGALWKNIRGAGLAYHYEVYVKPETGMMYFLLSKSTHVAKAYKEGGDIMMGYVKGDSEFSDVEIDSAKSSLIFEIIEEEKTVGDVAAESMVSYFRGVDHDYNKKMLEKVSKVTVADLKRVGEQYIAPLFDSSVSRTVVCCNPSKIGEVVQEFKELDVDLTILESLETDFLIG
ncbi:hypothetical protein FSP39_017783 [Pinctada imbricata]|uniref:Peptidase M16C associated domain-containing protein n=1 Tax=Pinctada imbricata TaxID=66713 RepID=A0AA89BZE9_PINIB|nr:hypothetical protein FSP39_017783 [Pinctada imbricata]